MNRYCFDTSSLVEAWSRSYPADVFPTFWDRMESVCDGQTILCPDEVLRELEKKDDDLRRWGQSKPSLWHPLDIPLQQNVKAILRDFPRFVEERRNKNRGDTFVIGLARNTGRCVVTEEAPSTKAGKHKIPDICTHYGVRWINLLEFIREQRWSF